MNKIDTLQRLLQVDVVAAAIKVPVLEWPGRCNEIALKLLDSGFLERYEPVNHYGHYTGPVTQRWYAWSARRPFYRHGWLALPDGTIIDPTRWCFTGEEPHIYVGPDPGDQYDWGGRAILAELRPPWPFMCEDGYGAVDRVHKNCKDERVELSPEFVEEFIPKNMFGEPQVELDDGFEDSAVGKPNATLRSCQVLWIASSPIDKLGANGKVVLRYLMRDGYRAWIPIDTRQWVEGRVTALGGGKW